MRININEIKVNSNRRKASKDDIQRIADSIAEVGMMNPITVDADHNLIAGLHRLEAAKLLGWHSYCETKPGKYRKYAFEYIHTAKLRLKLLYLQLARQQKTN